MGRHGREEFDSYVLVFICKTLVILLMVVQILFFHADIRQELSLVDKLEGVPLIDGRIDERPLTEKILTTILPFAEGN